MSRKRDYTIFNVWHHLIYTLPITNNDELDDHYHLQMTDDKEGEPYK